MAFKLNNLALALACAVPLSTLLVGCATDKASQPMTELKRKPALSDTMSYYDIHHPVIGRNGMVVSQSALASDVGAEILRQGGNAVDAAVAVGFALAVTLPRAGNLAGGGFMLVHLAKENKTLAINYREMAPKAAHRDLFLDDTGKVDHHKSLQTLAASGVPGTVAGFDYALKHYGTMSLAQVLVPAIKLAQQGILVNDDMIRIMKKELPNLQANAETCRVFLAKNCQLPQVGEILVQSDLARTLSHIAQHGKASFYQGDIAKKIVAHMQSGNGLITMEDLAAYKVEEEPLMRGTYQDYEIVTMPPPSSGGVHLIQMMNMLEQLPMDDVAQGSANLLHLQTEISKRAYADRSKFLGDPDFVQMPLSGLLSKEYAKELVADISLDALTRSKDIAHGEPQAYESPDTTHFSVMDSQGNVVSNTYTLNHYYGSSITIPGTGMLINNTMDDFTAKIGVANSYGLVGGQANAVAGKKQPLSSMTPTIVFKAGKPFLATGTPGGSKIITSVFQQLVNILHYDMNVSEATNAPRTHHQWQPDILYVEQGISPDTLDILSKKGYQIELTRSLGSLQSIMFKDGVFYGAADPRRPNAKAVALP
ncbi:gamma-glutamyltransferase [Litorilituus sediminis]|uniref:Glutathione hydrolase proenzyme n=1 Tax=Litorilituus sediminis TaxID=718192 RepID=A0A4P6P2X6_9GAMM|nr:gamma-glutamyltransferase [Litorilituus sediminis]QBG35613.1 gamma-glutamyltransferase [Litorilituus sediminis]